MFDYSGQRGGTLLDGRGIPAKETWGARRDGLSDY